MLKVILLQLMRLLNYVCVPCNSYAQLETTIRRLN